MLLAAPPLLALLTTEAGPSPALDGFRKVDTTFCIGASANGHATATMTAEGCAELCAKQSDLGRWGFDFDCGGTQPQAHPKPCIVLSSAAACKGLKRSSCGSQVYINRSFPDPRPVPVPPPAPAPPVKPSYDVTKFETELLPKWIEQYKLPGAAGNFSFRPGGQRPHPYAASDVLHVLCGTGQLGTLSAA
eukprot:SAG11_NODE_10190_length_848_cov_1.707610_1_plen_189_part_10